MSGSISAHKGTWTPWRGLPSGATAMGPHVARRWRDAADGLRPQDARQRTMGNRRAVGHCLLCKAGGKDFLGRTGCHLAPMSGVPLRPCDPRRPRDALAACRPGRRRADGRACGPAAAARRAAPHGPLRRAGEQGRFPQRASCGLRPATECHLCGLPAGGMDSTQRGIHPPRACAAPAGRSTVHSRGHAARRKNVRGARWLRCASTAWRKAGAAPARSHAGLFRGRRYLAPSSSKKPEARAGGGEKGVGTGPLPLGRGFATDGQMPGHARLASPGRLPARTWMASPPDGAARHRDSLPPCCAARLGAP